MRFNVKISVLYVAIIIF